MLLQHTAQGGPKIFRKCKAAHAAHANAATIHSKCDSRGSQPMFRLASETPQRVPCCNQPTCFRGTTGGTLLDPILLLGSNMVAQQGSAGRPIWFCQPHSHTVGAGSWRSTQDFHGGRQPQTNTQARSRQTEDLSGEHSRLGYVHKQTRHMCRSGTSLVAAAACRRVCCRC